MKPSQQLDLAELRWRDGQCPKCGHRLRTDTAPASPDTPCPACDIVPSKYLRFLLNSHEQAKREAIRNKVYSRLEHRAGSSWALSEWLPTEVFRWAKWEFALIGLILLVSGGYSVFDLPTREILYDPVRSPVRCTGHFQDPEAQMRALARHGLVAEADRCATTGICPSLCWANYALYLGNTGLLHQPQVVVRLNERPLQYSSMSPVFLDYDRAQRKVEERSRDGIRSYALGAMGPTEQVVLRMILTAQDRDELPQWDDILRKVVAAKGEVHAGPPKLSLLIRMMLRIFFAVTPMDVVTTTRNVFLDQ